MFCEGRILDIDGKPIPNCTIETWETDDEGLYDTQYGDRTEADCRGRLTSDANGYYSVRRFSFSSLSSRVRFLHPE